MRVFIPEENPRYNIDAAKTYGDLIYFGGKGSINPFIVDKAMDGMLRGFLEHEFDPEEDFLCLTGKSLVVALFLAVAIQNYGTVKTLMFTSRDSIYREIVITVPGEQ